MNDFSETARNLANYDSEWSVAQYQSTVGLWPIEAALVERYFPAPPATVLELGCGAGRVTVGLTQRGYRVLPLDLSWPLLVAAKQRYPDLPFVKMDAVHLGCASGSVDAVMFSYNGIDVLYPSNVRVACMREAFRVLRSGGTFVMSSHNVLGTLWSAGPFYWPSYRKFVSDLTRHWRDKRLWQWYWPYEDGGGAQNLYSAPPRHTAQQLRSVGFDVLDVCGTDPGSAWWRVMMQQQHVNYVARKP